jgi:hypothetical protein
MVVYRRYFVSLISSTGVHFLSICIFRDYLDESDLPNYGKRMQK